MKILAISTSSNTASVALLEDDKCIQELNIINEKTHSEKLMPLIDELFKNNKVTLSDIGLIACDNGPGSFTGIRIGVATVKAMAEAKNIPVVSCSSLEGLAYNVTGFDYICSLIDARNNQVYLRFRTTIGGYYNPDVLMRICEVADKYNAKIKLTSREEIEIQEIDLCDVEDIVGEFEDDEVLINGTEGPLFRSIMACPGSEHCNLGLVDTNELAEEIEKNYAEKPANYKFKMGITGCPNRCLAVTTTDFGINGVKTPETKENCNGCGRCQDVCKVDAIEVRGDTSIINYGICVGCGKCIGACPNDAKGVKFEGYSLYIGGKGGRETIIGHQVYAKTKSEIYDTLEAVFEVYNDLSIKPQKERLAHTIKRVGDLDFFNKVEEYKRNNL